MLRVMGGGRWDRPAPRSHTPNPPHPNEPHMTYLNLRHHQGDLQAPQSWLEPLHLRVERGVEGDVRGWVVKADRGGKDGLAGW